MVDRYTKVVLTVIAVALMWLCLWGPGPKWGTPAQAAGGRVDVNIATIGGWAVMSPDGGLPVTGVRTQKFPVEVKPLD